MKKLLLFSFCVILIVALVGCGQNKEVLPENVVDETTNETINEIAGETTIPTDNEDLNQDVPNNTETSENETAENTTDENKNETINETIGETTEEKPTEVEKPKSENTETEKVEKPNDTKNEETTIEPETTQPITTDHIPTEIELEVLKLMNQERAKEGLSALTYNSTIYDCGVIRANECLTKWSHTRPDGTQYWTVFEECDKKITTCCGENLAKTFTSAEQIVEVLMNSEGHRKNILYKDFTSVCITILKDNEGYYYMSQLFMGK